jgi:hypothetical protein
MKTRNMLTTACVALLLVFAAPAMAATWNWTNNVASAWWTNGNSWLEGTVPDSLGTTDIVLSNSTAGAYVSYINENWTLNSLTFKTPAAGTFTIAQAGTRTLNIGAGGITGNSSRMLHINPNVTFTASDVSLNGGNIYLYGTTDSSAVGGTIIRAKGADWTYVQSSAAKSTANVTPIASSQTF